ncbi:hypothetical protein KKB55_17250 [Myxococcota bacterium]|nr:hypothetical protein [Myxococcota bacterium]MBU1899491.1 hypothetical protein [Myxococcota bacterium]
MRRAVIALVVIGALTYFLVKSNSRYGISFPVQGRTFVKAKVVSLDGVDNYFYAEEGVEADYANELVQLYVFDDDVPDQSRRVGISKIKNDYGLKEVGEETGEYIGEVRRAGLNLVTCGLDIEIDNRPSFIAFFRGLASRSEADEAKEEIDAILEDLHEVAALLAH